MNYRLQKLPQDRWRVFDPACEQSCFEGNLSACQDWLDWQEGLQQTSLWTSLKFWFQSLSHAKPQAIPQGLHAEHQMLE